MGVKSSSPDHLWVVNSHNVVSSDEFFVDDLLDLSNEDAFVEKDPNPVPKQDHRQEDDKQRGCDQHDEEDVDFLTPAGEISVPSDDLANLEWLSHFVEDSDSFSATPFLTGVKPIKMIEVPLKQGAATGGRVWSLGSAALTESTSSSTTSSSCSSPSSPWPIYAHPNPEDPACSVQNRVFRKKQKKKKKKTGTQTPRRCSHCGVQKTPQWRTGPLGAKTLCNACGVRFKSGRLLPEYRPACSPTFSTELHSNNHRKVLEMRRKKDYILRRIPVWVHMPLPVFDSRKIVNRTGLFDPVSEWTRTGLVLHVFIVHFSELLSH